MASTIGLRPSTLVQEAEAACVDDVARGVAGDEFSGSVAADEVLRVDLIEDVSVLDRDCVVLVDESSEHVSAPNVTDCDVRL
jgi:hypothetical protein